MMKKITVLTIMFCLLFFPVINIQARHLSYGWPNPNVPLNSFSFNATWQTPMLNAISNWNTRNTPINFMRTSVSNNMVHASAQGSNITWYGLHEVIARNGSTLVTFRITLNSTRISRDATNFSNFVTSVFAHELGHSIWLADNPAGTTANGSIMNHSRNRNTLTVPTSFDVQSVNMKY